MDSKCEGHISREGVWLQNTHDFNKVLDELMGGRLLRQVREVSGMIGLLKSIEKSTK